MLSHYNLIWYSLNVKARDERERFKFFNIALDEIEIIPEFNFKQLKI